MELLLSYFGHILTSQTLYNLIFFVSRLLNGNELTGSLPEELGYLPKLDRIQIDQNYISGPLPKSFANLNKTKHLWEFSDATCPKTAGCLSSCFTILFFFLVFLFLFIFFFLNSHMNNNSISGQIPPELSRLPSLVHM